MSVTATPMVASWNAGELSPMMAGRTDTAIYAIGAEIMENFAPAVEGPIVKRPGFRRIVAAASSSTWLMRFVFNTTQAYVLECLEQKLRLFTNGGRIESGGSPVEVVVPFAAAEWPRVSTFQSFDRLYMAHPNHAPGRLNRTGAASFTYEALELVNGPFKDGNSDDGVTVTATGVLTAGGTVTLAASAPIFEDGHAGGLFRIEAKDFSDIPAWQAGIDGVVSGTTLRRSEGRVYLAASGGRTGPVQPVHDEGTEWDGDASGHDVNDEGPYGVKWTYQYDSFGVVRITSVESGTSATATVLRRLPSSLATVASWRWAHGAFSAAEGWPDLVFTWAGRLCFWKGFDLHCSVVGDYLNFQSYSSVDRLTDDLAFWKPLAASDPPLWVVVDRDLYVGTLGGEYVIGRISPQAPLSGENIEARRQSGYGCTGVWPIQPGTSTVFMQRGGSTFRQAEYDFGRDRYAAANISRWARHIGRPGIVQLGQQAVPEEMFFGVRSDGQLVTRTYDPEQEVKGFARTVLGGSGTVLSAVSIPSDDGTRDEIWALCAWNGVKSIQRQEEWWRAGEMELADSFFVDDGLADSLDDPSDTVSGLAHLAGTEVAILADGSVCPRQTVPSTGTITLPFAASKRVVGRPYVATLRTLPIEARDPSGQTAQGKRARLTRLILRLLDTLLIKARVRSDTAAQGYRDEQLLDRPVAADMDAPPPLFSGDTDGRSVGGDWGRDGRFTVVSDDPVPAIVLAAMPHFEVSGA